MEEYKSLYEELIDRLTAEGRIKVLSEADNMQIMKELNEGMADWDREQRVKNHESWNELKNILLD